jgi:16S rRNA (uracil1498-N3)-methyltransferase
MSVILCDDISGEWARRVVSVGKREVVLDVVEQLRPREQVPDVWLCAALLKKDASTSSSKRRPSSACRRVQPVLARRCVADRLNSERARAVMTEAAEQCARTRCPSWPSRQARRAAARLARGRRCSSPTSLAASRGRGFRCERGPRALLIGPEGGFDDAERAAVRALPQARAITLGPRILRGETAAIAAARCGWDRGRLVMSDKAI